MTARPFQVKFKFYKKKKWKERKNGRVEKAEISFTFLAFLSGFSFFPSSSDTWNIVHFEFFCFLLFSVCPSFPFKSEFYTCFSGFQIFSENVNNFKEWVICFCFFIQISMRFFSDTLIVATYLLHCGYPITCIPPYGVISLFDNG